MKKSVQKFFEAKEKQRKKNAARPVADKLRTLDRLKEGVEQLKRAKYASTGRKVRPD